MVVSIHKQNSRKEINNKFLIGNLIVFSLSLTGCFKEFQEQANTQFGDQHFKSAIALIELYKIRAGEYLPELGKLKYLANVIKSSSLQWSSRN